MPNNEANPYRADEALHAVFENGGPEIRAALLADYEKTKGDRHLDDVRAYVTDLKEQVAEVMANPYAPTAWGQPKERDFECPSGQLCRVRRVDIMDLMAGGILNDMDFLTSMVTSEHIPNGQNAGRSSAKAVQGITGNEENMIKFRHVMADVLVRVVVAPMLLPVPQEGEGRLDGAVYVDTVNMTDQIAIFNWAVTGKEATELTRFRDETQESLGNVANVEGVSAETVDLPRDSPIA